MTSIKTRRLCREQVEGHLQEFGLKVRLRNMVSGNIVHWPGVCTRDNGWTLDASKFHVRDLKGSIVVAEHPTTGENDVSKQMKVQAVLSCDGEATPGGFSLRECAKGPTGDGTYEVLIICGDKPFPFFGMRCEQIPCADVDDIKTPPTPPPTI